MGKLYVESIHDTFTLEKVDNNTTIRDVKQKLYDLINDKISENKDMLYSYSNINPSRIGLYTCDKNSISTNDPLYINGKFNREITLDIIQLENDKTLSNYGLYIDNSNIQTCRNSLAFQIFQ
jgi:hypothetical protein